MGKLRECLEKNWGIFTNLTMTPMSLNSHQPGEIPASYSKQSSKKLTKCALNEIVSYYWSTMVILIPVNTAYLPDTGLCWPSNNPVSGKCLMFAGYCRHIYPILGYAGPALTQYRVNVSFLLGYCRSQLTVPLHLTTPLHIIIHHMPWSSRVCNVLS